MNLFRRFTFNPFEPLRELLGKIDGCVAHIRPMLEAACAGEYSTIKDHFREVTQAEHEADIIKNSIRSKLSRSLFMPIDRWHFLDIISAADRIADRVEDLAYLLTVRDTHIPDALDGELIALTEKCLEAYAKLVETVSEFDPLVESGFSGPLADEVLKNIDRVCELEWESDKLGYKFTQHIFKLEGEISTLDLLMLRDLGRELTRFADSVESLAKQIRRTLHA